MIVSIADVPSPENRLVGMAIADGCGTDAAGACPGASHGTHAGYWRCDEEGMVGHAC